MSEDLEMHDLYATVVRHLKSQRDSASAMGLWNDLWAAYEKGDADGVGELVEQLIEWPDTEEEKS